MPCNTAGITDEVACHKKGCVAPRSAMRWAVRAHKPFLLAFKAAEELANSDVNAPLHALQEDAVAERHTRCRSFVFLARWPVMTRTESSLVSAECRFRSIFGRIFWLTILSWTFFLAWLFSDGSLFQGEPVQLTSSSQIMAETDRLRRLDVSSEEWSSAR